MGDKNMDDYLNDMRVSVEFKKLPSDFQEVFFGASSH